jgi:Type II secretion system (T2SS), protein N
MPASRSPSRTAKVNPPARGRWPLVLAGLIVALAATIFVLPASLLARFLPNAVHAEDFSGSLIHGAAARISINGRDAGAIEWQLHPLALLGLSIAMNVHWVNVGFVVDGVAQIDRNGFVGHDLKGGGPLEDLRDLGLPPGWRGNCTLSISEIKSNFNRLLAASGRIEVAGVSSADIAQGADLGGYSLELPAAAVSPDGSITANLNDTGGPVEIKAQIRFSSATRTGLLSGTIKERADIAPALKNQLDNLAQLHRPDAQGAFPIDLEFTL